MKTKVNQFPDELKMKVVQEYLQTDQSQKELMQKYNIRGNNCPLPFDLYLKNLIISLITLVTQLLHPLFLTLFFLSTLFRQQFKAGGYWGVHFESSLCKTAGDGNAQKRLFM